MKVTAIYEDGKLMALCAERGAASTLQAELYYGHSDKTTDSREIEISDELWQQWEAQRETFEKTW
jgi:hypothetical protein